MKLPRFAFVLLMLIATALLQSCGSGSKSDTGGSLTLSSPTITNNTDGTYSVTTTATYIPPAGKVPNGVVIKISETENGVLGSSFEDTLTDSNAVIRTFVVVQSTQASKQVVVTASIGDMTSSVLAIVPALATVSATPVQFLSSDPAGTPRITTISGGIAPYTLVAVSTADISASLNGTTLTVTNLVAPAVGATPVATPATVSVNDSIGNTSNVQVVYFK